jgi:hypothetical protein
MSHTLLTTDVLAKLLGLASGSPAREASATDYGVGRLTLRESLGCVQLALRDESQHRLASFRDARALP